MKTIVFSSNFLFFNLLNKLLKNAVNNEVLTLEIFQVKAVISIDLSHARDSRGSANILSLICRLKTKKKRYRAK